MCKKSRIRELLNVSMCADSNTNRKKILQSFPTEDKNFICHLSSVAYHVPHGMSQVSPIKCHLSLMPTATATDPPPPKSPTMHSMLVCQDRTQQLKKNVKTHLFKKGSLVLQF